MEWPVRNQAPSSSGQLPALHSHMDNNQGWLKSRKLDFGLIHREVPDDWPWGLVKQDLSLELPSKN